MSNEQLFETTEGRTEPIMEVRNLQTTFFTDKETIRAVDGVSFDITPGETVGIVGESGSGKSVTARSLMRLIDSPGEILRGSSIRFKDLDSVQAFADKFPKRTVTVEDLKGQYDPRNLLKRTDATPSAFGYESASEVTLADILASGYADDLGIIDGDDCVFVTAGTAKTPEAGFIEVTRTSGEAKRLLRGGRISMIFQDPLTSLNPVYTVGNQIKEALNLHQGLRDEEANKEAISLLEAVGIPDARRRLKEYPHQFSGGMRQRAVIAMALACEPEVLICDEPTTALDVTIQAQILDLIEEIQDQRNLAVMFITHDMGVIANISDQVNVMYAGEIVETADVDQLFNDPKHPYTRGLLKSIPGQQGPGEELATIDGTVPTPNEPASYCRFAPRCPKAFEECNAVHPKSVQVEADTETHTAACLLYPSNLTEIERIQYHEGESK